MQILGQKCTVRGIHECLHSELVDDAFGGRNSMSLGHPALFERLVTVNSHVFGRGWQPEFDPYCDVE